MYRCCTSINRMIHYPTEDFHVSLSVAVNTYDGNILTVFSLLRDCFSSIPQVWGHDFKQCMRRAGVRIWAIEWRRQGSWHLTWRLSDRRGTIRSASACHPSRPLRNRAAETGPVNCLQMCPDACFTDKHEAGAALWWSRRSLLICISLAERTTTL